MSFFEEIKSLLYDNGFPAPTFRALMVGDYAIHLENVNSIVSLEQDQITVRLSKGGVTIKGKDLYVKKYCEGDLVICGKIVLVERI